MVTWDDVVVVIPTVKERASMLTSLIAQLQEQLPRETRLNVHMHNPSEPARTTFPKALSIAGRMDRPWVLQLEDDVHLAPTFGAEALAVGLNGCDVLTLFTRSRFDLKAMDLGQRVRQINPSSFSMSQAFFIKSDLAREVATYAPDWYERHPQHNRAADLLLASFLSAKRASVLARVPSLVQHRRGPSTLPGHYGARQSESYRRAFGEVP